MNYWARTWKYDNRDSDSPQTIRFTHSKEMKHSSRSNRQIYISTTDVDTKPTILYIM